MTDPRALLRSAVNHGMGGLLLAELERSEPQWRRLALTVLGSRQRSVEVWHGRLWAGLLSVTDVLDDLGIDAAVVKGVAAELRWYDARGQRPCSDLDLLVSPEHLHRLDDVVAAIEPSHPLCGQVVGLARAGLLQSVDLVHDGVPIDLHWDLFKLGVPSRSRELIWERTVLLDAPSGRPVRALDAEASFVHFLLHANKDRFRRLLAFVDPTRIDQRADLDLSVVRRLASGDGIESSIAESWNVIVDTLGLPSSQPFAVPRTLSSRLRSAAWRRAWRPEVRLRAAESTVRFRRRQWLIPLLARGRALETARCWLRTSVPPADLLAYLHSDYARRWGAEPVAVGRRGRLWSLTVGRVKASVDRRRSAAAAVQRVRGGH